MVELQVLKQSGIQENYSEEKLRRSLEFTGATPDQVNRIIRYIDGHLKPGVTTRRIYTLAFNQLRKIAHSLSAYYGTKMALSELGTDGYIFEKYVARILTYSGYETINNVDIAGRCVSHEVDVVADCPDERVLIECKFHKADDRHNDLKTVLYIKARATDIAEGERGSDFSRFLLISNTSFSGDAIRYSTCAGLHIWGANFPPQYTLQDYIREYRLDPVTCLSSLRKNEKKMLIDSDVLLIRDILDNTKVLKDIGMENYRADRTIAEIRKLLSDHQDPGTRLIP